MPLKVETELMDLVSEARSLKLESSSASSSDGNGSTGRNDPDTGGGALYLTGAVVQGVGMALTGTGDRIPRFSST